MGFHGAKLQIVTWIIGLNRAAILKVCLDVPPIGRCEKAQINACGTVLFSFLE